MKRTYRLYLNDINEAIERIEVYVKDLTFEEFSKNMLVIDAVVRNFELLAKQQNTYQLKYRLIIR